MRPFGVVNLFQSLRVFRLEKHAWHVLRLPVEFFSQRFAGDLANRIEANDRVARLLARAAQSGSPRAGLGTGPQPQREEPDGAHPPRR